MYERFYGLRARPFDATPNPDFLVATRVHREALANLEYGIRSTRGITVLIGEAGMGKTTLLRKALATTGVAGPSPDTRPSPEAGRGLRTTNLVNPTLSRGEFNEFLASSFSLSDAAATSKTRLLRELEAMLRRKRDQGELCVLVIDEAQRLPAELLEEVRLLTNIETETEKLLSVVLAGQPELADRLNEPELRQFKQRIVLRATLTALSTAESAQYIAARIRLAGGDPTRVFTLEAVNAICAHARGIPRVISMICENALLGGFALGRRPIDRPVVMEVCNDFDLRPLSGESPALPVASATSPEPVAVAEPELEAPLVRRTDRLSSRRFMPDWMREFVRPSRQVESAE